MHRKILTIALAAVIGAGLAAVQALTQQQPRPALEIAKVKDDLYNIVGNGGNVAVLVTNEGVLLIDDKFEQDHDQIIAKVKSVTMSRCVSGGSLSSCASTSASRCSRDIPSNRLSITRTRIDAEL